MTKPRYLQGCAAGSQVHRLALASDPDSNAWNVNFNNGNSNNNNQNNTGLVLAVRSASECQVTVQQLYRAWQDARRQKSSFNQMQWETRWMDGLLKLQVQINTCSWEPSPSTCSIATAPKAREIHAPDFADRVMHHWLVPQLEAVFEPGFIHDSFANRTGKGTHAAVQRLQQHVRQVHNGQGGGYYLQLDIHNFFNSIHRPTLWALLKPRIERAGLPAIAQQATHALIRRSPMAQGVVYRAKPAERAQVPPHKRLENAAPGCGLPIGNLSSQFFANVYLDALDQFIKHVLKIKRYVRYVDDFVLVHQSREQLEQWQAQIETFLHERLQLKLKADIKLRPLTDGCDFLGYVIYPTHTRVRSRVVSHARSALTQWHNTFARETLGNIHVTPAAIRQLGSVWASYQGHFAHANSHRLQQQFYSRFPWLSPLTQVQRRFNHQLEGKRVAIRVAA